MNKLRLLTLLLVGILSIGGFTAVTTTNASAATLEFSIKERNIFHKNNSDRITIAVASEFKGKGTRGFIDRGHRGGGESPSYISSVFVPKGCTLYTNGWRFWHSWTEGHWANIAKYPFGSVNISLQC